MDKRDWNILMGSEVFREYIKVSQENEEEKIAIASEEEADAYEALHEFQERINKNAGLRNKLLMAKNKALRTPGVNPNFIAGLMMLDLGEE